MGRGKLRQFWRSLRVLAVLAVMHRDTFCVDPAAGRFPTIPPAVGTARTIRLVGVARAGPHFGLLGRLASDIQPYGPQAPYRGNRLLLAVTGLAAAALGGVYVALGREQPFYDQALASSIRRRSRTGSRELESRATALYSETRQPGKWRAAFTDDQINGWLAVQLAEHLCRRTAGGNLGTARLHRR